MKFRALALSAVAAGSLGLAACGDDSGSGDVSGVDARQLLVKTFDGSSAPMKSGTIELELGGEITGEDAGNGTLTAKVAVNEAPKKGELPTFAAEFGVKGKAEGQELDEKFGATYVDNRFFIAYDGENYDVGEEFSKQAVAEFKKQAEATGAQEQANEDLVKQLGLDPATWLKDPKVTGEEKIGDADTYKITGEVDIKTMVPDVLEAAEKAQQIAPGAAGQEEIPEVSQEDLAKAEEQIETLTLTVWTGKDDTVLRKLDVDTKIKDDGGKSTLDGGFALTITNLNEEQDVKAPSDTKPFTDLLPKLQGLGSLLGGGAMGATGGDSGASGSSESLSADQQELLECVQKAGGDAEKIQACQQ